MALTKISRSLLDTGISDSSDATAVTIDSSENVGIGTTSPTTFSGFKTLHLKNGSGDALMLIESDGGIISQDIVSDSAGVVTVGARSNHAYRITTNDTERMRIDTSGNVGIAAIPAGEAAAAHVVRLGDRVCIAEYDDGSNPEQFNLFHNSDSSETYIEAGTASVIQQRAGVLTFKNAASGSAGAAITFSERFRIDADGGVGIGNPTATNYALEVEGAQIGRGSVYFHTTMPLADATYDLGHSSYRWRNMYLSGTTYSSDRNEKNTIVDSDLGLDFVKRLTPKSYKFNDGTSGRTHYGLIAQDVEDVLSDISKTGQDFAGFCKDEPTDPPKHDKDNPVTETRYGLRYTEFIAPMIKAIQEQQTQIEALQSEINLLKGE